MMTSGKIQDIYELTPTQQGMLFHSLYTPGVDVYNNQLQFALRGVIDPDRFHRAWQAVVARHTVLRTGFAWNNLKQPYQVVHRSVELDISWHNWCFKSVEEQRADIAVLADVDKSKEFCLETPPLMRLSIVQLSERDYCFLWTFHHMILEGWSAAILMREVSEIYEANSREPTYQFEPTLDYSEYIRWLLQLEPAGAENYWRNALQGFSQPNHLPMDSVQGDAPPRVAHCTEFRWQISPEQTQALNRFARDNRLTLATLFLGAWALMLGRYTRSSDTVFGLMVSGRSADLTGIESMVGLCVNTLPARVEIDATDQLLSWLQSLQRDQAKLRKYEHSSITQAQTFSEVPPGRPLFETLVVFQNWGAQELEHDVWLGDVEVLSRHAYEGSDYPLTFLIAPGEEITAVLRYDPQRFEQETVGRMHGHLNTLLDAFVAEPYQCLGNLPIVTQQEREQLLVEWNQTASVYPREASLVTLFQEQVSLTPNAPAVAFGEEDLTYSELDARATRLAQRLCSLGVGPEVLVGLCVTRSLEMVVGLLGILKSGGAYVALDPEYPRERQSFMLKDAGIEILVTQAGLIAGLPAEELQIICLEGGQATSEPREEPTDSSFSDRTASAHNTAYILYTSGSTGQPKGVVVEHGSAVAMLSWAKSVFSRDEVSGVLASTSICFDLSVFEIFLPLVSGGTVIVVPSALDLPQLSSEPPVTLINTVPSAMRELVRMNALPGTVRVVNLAGEPLTNTLVQDVYRFQSVEKVYNLYGPSEDTTYSTFVLAVKGAEADPGIGRPIANTQAYVLDECLAPVPIGVPGELYLGGAGLARGYLNRPGLTAEKFIADPFSVAPGARLYRTGDLVRYLPDGNLAFLGRIDHQVKVRGFRIEMGEIEAALRQFPEVQEAVVAVVDAPGGDKVLVAYVVPVKDALSPSVLRQSLQETLPEYMVPSAYVRLEAVPLTPNGKVDRKALPVPEGQRQVEDRYIAPRAGLETSIAEIWRELLGVEQPGIHDNFFEIGGNSLVVMRFYDLLETRLDVRLSPTDLFRFPTIHLLAQKIERPEGISGSVVRGRERARLQRQSLARHRSGVTKN